MTRSTWWGRLAVGTGAAVVVAIGVLLFAETAGGANLGPVYPIDGTVLREPPGRVSLSFDTTVRPEQIHIGVADNRGDLVPSGAPVVAGTTITEPVTIRADGEYLLAYHIVLTDGRSFSGVNRFQVSSSLAAATIPATSSPSPAAVAAGHDHFGDDPLSVGLTIVAGLFVVALLVLLIHRPRPRRS
jgi:copper resistance protein C